MTKSVRLAARHHLALGSLLLLLALLTRSNIHEASSLPFWYDEIFTVTITRLDSMAAVWRALGRAVDSSPPGFYLVQRVASRLASNQHIAFRLASIAALPVISLSLFGFARPRLGSLGALIAAVVPLTTVVYPQYALEARPSILMLCCLSLAILAWQRARHPLWLFALSGSLAAAVSQHYYAVFGLVPFVIAEAIGFLIHRQPRVRVWIALAAGMLPLVLFWPFLRELHATYAAHYFLTPSLPYTLGIYDWYFNAHPAGAMAAVGLLLSLTLIVCAAVPRFSAGGVNVAHQHPEEVALAVGFIVVPFFVMLGTAVAGGGLVARYGLAGILGFALGTAYVSRLLGRTAQTILLISLLAAAGSRQMSYALTVTTRQAQLNDSAKLLAKDSDPSMPLVVSDGVDFLPLAYYRSERDPPVMALIDPPAAVRFAGTDSVDLDLAALRHYLPIQVVDYSEFVLRHDHFLLYSTGGPFDWWPRRLLADHYSFQVVTIDGKNTLYRVARTRDAQGDLLVH